ncbi:MAG TPA: 3-isopropylmalate dehydratase small subunit [Steroidobacteraceae bacterium]|nr:3-isopropylmalate dehydratase small subunit [Steroidobacteraceae bacterium]
MSGHRAEGGRAAEGVRVIRSRTVVLPVADVDTDQIVPARFLTTTSREGLGRALFADWRYDAMGRPRADFVLNRPEAADCGILVAGPNFGCGSSREHAAWALLDAGFRAVVSSSIADIFFTNALKNGLVPVRADAETHAWLLSHPGAVAEVDVARGMLRLPGGREAPFALDPFARHCLVQGLDELGYLLSRLPDIQAWENTRRA